MLVITAPTAKIGSQVLADVLAADPGQPVRIVARDPAKLPAAVRDRVEVVPGSHADPAVVARAFDGADTVFWLVPPDHGAATVADAYSGFTRPAAAALRTHGVRRVVDVSALGRGTAVADRAGYVTASLAMDDLLAGTGVALRSLCLPSFMDNQLRGVPAIAHDAALVDTVDPDRPLPTAATRDIAAVAARLLLDDGWTGRRDVPVLGPEHLTGNEMAAIVSEVLGTPVSYRRLPYRTLGAQLDGYGLSPAMRAGMVEMMVAKDNGLDDGVARTAEHAVQTPTTFRQWCTEVLAPAVQAA